MTENNEEASTAEINRLHSELKRLATVALDRAIRIGELLFREKEAIGHGEWLPWLKGNITFSERTASNYMSVFRNRERLKSANVADLTKAYRLLGSRTVAVEFLHDQDQPTMSVAEAEALHREIVTGLELIFDNISAFADSDIIWQLDEPGVRERLGQNFLPVLVLDKVAELVRANAHVRIIHRQVVQLVIQQLLNTARRGSGDELFADNPQSVASEHSKGDQ